MLRNERQPAEGGEITENGLIIWVPPKEDEVIPKCPITQRSKEWTAIRNEAALSSQQIQAAMIEITTAQPTEPSPKQPQNKRFLADIGDDDGSEETLPSGRDPRKPTGTKKSLPPKTASTPKRKGRGFSTNKRWLWAMPCVVIAGGIIRLFVPPTTTQNLPESTPQIQVSKTTPLPSTALSISTSSPQPHLSAAVPVITIPINSSWTLLHEKEIPKH